jgi:hypothetical protein
MAKTSKLTTGKTKVSNNGSNITEKELRHFTTKLIEWARDNEDALDPVEFVMRWDIPLKTYRNWLNTYPIVSEANEEAMEYIGLRRDKKWLSGEHVSGAGRWIPAFKQQYKMLLEYEAKLKTDNPDNETKIVILKDYPDAKE